MMVSMFLSTEILMMLGNTVSELTERLDDCGGDVSDMKYMNENW